MESQQPTSLEVQRQLNLLNQEIITEPTTGIIRYQLHQLVETLFAQQLTQQDDSDTQLQLAQLVSDYSNKSILEIFNYI